MSMIRWSRHQHIRKVVSVLISCFFLMFIVQPVFANASPISQHKVTTEQILLNRVSHKPISMWERTQWTLVTPPFFPQRPTAPPTKRLRVSKVTPSNLPRSSLKDIDLRGSLTLPTPQKTKKKVAKKSEEELKREREKQIGLWHQIFGLSSLALMAASVVLGQINAIDFLSGRLSSEPMIWAHRGLVIGTSITYLATRILAWMLPKLAPDDDDDDAPKGFDSSKWHNLLSWIHGIGMIALVVGGFINARLIPSNTPAKTIFTVSHLVGGYVTLASLGAAAIVISFF